MTQALAWHGLLLLLLVAGESAHVRLAPRRGVSPIASAAAVAFMLSLPVVEGLNPVVVVIGGMLVVTIGVILGAAIAEASGRATSSVDVAGRLTNALVAGILGQAIALSGLQEEVASDDQHWIYALAITLAALMSSAVRTVVVTLVAARTERRSFGVCLQDEVVTFGMLSIASATTAAMVVLSRAAIGLWGPVFFVLPLALSFAAARRYAHIRQTYRETIAALARLTDLAGYTTPDHARRVADLSVELARRRGLSQREIDTLEYAALLHDLGQVALEEPIPGGATVLAAPRDQERIATDGVAIMRHSGMLDGAAELLARQAIPFRRMLEDDERIPLEARIIKLANAFDDLTGGSRDRGAESLAIERIQLGLGYEYDPALVDDLISVVHEQRPSQRRES